MSHIIFEQRGRREDIEAEDDMETYFKWLEENPNAGVVSQDNDDDQDIDYDEDGNIIVPEKSKVKKKEKNSSQF